MPSRRGLRLPGTRWITYGGDTTASATPEAWRDHDAGVGHLGDLRTLGDGQASVYFYRWNTHQCPEPAAKALGAAVDDLLARNPKIESLQLIGHSYGGIISALAAARYGARAPLVVDLVASPLAGVPALERRCGYSGPIAPATNASVTLRRWQTRHELDKAFANIEPDPQVVELPGEVTRLPSTYRGHRLGHIDHLAGGAPPLSAAPLLGEGPAGSIRDEPVSS